MSVLDTIKGTNLSPVLARMRASLVRGFNRAVEARLTRVEREIAIFRIHHAADVCTRRRGDRA